MDRVVSSARANAQALTFLFAMLCFVPVRLLASEDPCELWVSVGRAPQTEREVIVRVEVRCQAGLPSGSTEMRLRAGSTGRAESVGKSRDSVIRKTIRATLNAAGDELSYEIEICRNDQVVASKASVVRVSTNTSR
jgi:hypothetical protein